jgi:16S rRNA (cytosine967-C5)-methyltransferase
LRPLDDTSLAAALAAAARVVDAVVGRGATVGTALAAPATRPRAILRPAVQDLCFTALRDYGFLPRLVDALVAKQTTGEMRALLYVALADLRDNPARVHTIVDQAVEAAALLSGERSRGFVNAVLRRYLRVAEPLERHAEATDEGRWRHPQWWIDRVRRAWPAAWQSVLEAGNGRAPMTLRVNARRTSVEDYLARLADAGQQAQALGADAVMLDRPVAVERLPGFAEGLVSVQDWGAQRASALLELRDGQRVLDACAAPGGKTGAVLERAAVEVVALDADETRLGRVRDNLGRLGEHALLIAGDAAEPSGWWDGRRFDRVLADVPCTASGVVRRHPDIKWLRRAGDLTGLRRLQASILDALWQVLAPGGKLLYATCSVFPEENRAQVDAFLAREPRARSVPLPALPPAGQLLPCREHDGFFYALLEKPR